MNFALLFFITLVTVVVAQENVSQPSRAEIKIRFNVDGCDDDGYFPLCGTGTIWKNVSSSVKHCEIDTNSCPKALAAYEAAGYPKSSRTYWQTNAAAASNAAEAANTAAEAANTAAADASAASYVAANAAEAANDAASASYVAANAAASYAANAAEALAALDAASEAAVMKRKKATRAHNDRPCTPELDRSATQDFTVQHPGRAATVDEASRAFFRK